MNRDIWNTCPVEPPAPNIDRSVKLVQLALSGYPQLAADTILNKENQGGLVPIVENSIQQLNLSFTQNGVSRKKCIEVLLELSLNFLGMERKRAGFSEEETEDCLNKIKETLEKWESSESGEDQTSTKIVIEQMLKGMKMVLSGKGMVAKMAEEIEAGLVKNDLGRSFIQSAKIVIQGNVYYQIVDGGLCKFGNDSATGLRWARHLGAVQVSSNPVIAARAYDEITDLWGKFDVVASAHPDWGSNPERFADEIALYGTVTSLLPNILDFRPIALLSDFRDGMVSIQLNPRKATSVEGSIEDARRIYSILQEILVSYDAHLASGAQNVSGRPNVVFKVSTCGAEATNLTESLDRTGIGTNNTVTFTVAQEIKMLVTAMRGLATALKSGIPITTAYITNMEGRLEDHLRENQATQLLLSTLKRTTDGEARIRSLADKIGALDEIEKAGKRSLEDQTAMICSKKYLKSLTDEWFIDALGKESAGYLNQMEQDIRMSGILVTRRVFQLSFSPALKSKWVKYIREEFGLSEEDAAKVVEAVDLLPASKRRAEDTYLVLGDSKISNLTNTEFPDHQLKVLSRSREKNFKLSDFENSISAEPDPAMIERLLQIPDFRRAYELTSVLVEEMNGVGIEVPKEIGGLAPEEWSSFGPVRKTMDEFTSAYVTFRSRLLSAIAKRTQDLNREEIVKTA